jgi:radical SAM superfamily enzyme YgiQ (UPF0313 family)
MVSVLDLSGVSNYTDVLSKYLNSLEANWLGITATTPQLPAAIKLAKIIREIRSDIKLVLGGPHVTLTYSAVKIEEKMGVNGGRAK